MTCALLVELQVDAAQRLAVVRVLHGETGLARVLARSMYSSRGIRKERRRRVTSSAL